MAEPAEGNYLLRRVRRGRLLWLIVVCPIVCSAVLCMFGGAYAVLLAWTAKPAALALRQFPEGVLLGVYMGIPVGSVSGFVGALLSAGLAHGALVDAGRARWLGVGSAIGAGLGVLAALCLAVVSADVGLREDLAIFGFTAVLAGASAGATVAWLAWREYAFSA